MEKEEPPSASPWTPNSRHTEEVIRPPKSTRGRGGSIPRWGQSPPRQPGKFCFVFLFLSHGGDSLHSGDDKHNRKFSVSSGSLLNLKIPPLVGSSFFFPFFFFFFFFFPGDATCEEGVLEGGSPGGRVPWRRGVLEVTPPGGGVSWAREGPRESGASSSVSPSETGQVLDLSCRFWGPGVCPPRREPCAPVQTQDKRTNVLGKGHNFPLTWGTERGPSNTGMTVLG